MQFPGDWIELNLTLTVRLARAVTHRILGGIPTP
jgi:hypothetical protein